MKSWAFLALALGCASPQQPPVALAPLPSMIPVEVDVDKLVPPEPPPAKIPGSYFEDQSLDGGRYCEKSTVGKDNCVDIPAGILLSEQSYARAISAESRAKRLDKERDILLGLRRAERAAVLDAEKAYQKRLVELSGENAELRRPRWWESFRFVGGFLLGSGLTALSAYGAVQAVR